MKLMHELLKARVRPYYIYMADQVAGGEHFRTTVQKGLEIIQALRGWTSGLAVPQFVIDAPGGGGKVPLLPEYVEEINDDEVIFRNYEGKRFSYKQPRQTHVPERHPVSPRSERRRADRGRQDGEEGARRPAEEVGERLTRSASSIYVAPEPRSLTIRQRPRARSRRYAPRAGSGRHARPPPTGARRPRASARPIGISLDELGDVPLAEAEQVVEDEHLAVRARAGADADHRNRHARGEQLGHGRRAPPRR